MKTEMNTVKVRKTEELEAEQLGAHIGEIVRLHGSIYKIRKMSSFAFVLLRTKRQMVQCVYEPAYARFALEELKEEACVRFTAEVIREERSRGTPRLANRILKRVRDFAQVKYDGRITKEVASFALDLLEVDRYGLDQTDRLLLTTIMEKFQGGPVGLDTLAASIGEDAGTIEDVYEPFLIKSGFINRTPRGRVATEFAWHHLGLEAPRKIEE